MLCSHSQRCLRFHVLGIRKESTCSPDTSSLCDIYFGMLIFFCSWIVISWIPNWGATLKHTDLDLANYMLLSIYKTSSKQNGAVTYVPLHCPLLPSPATFLILEQPSPEFPKCHSDIFVCLFFPPIKCVVKKVLLLRLTKIANHFLFLRKFTF